MTRTRMLQWTLGIVGLLMLVVGAGGFLLLRSRGFHRYVLAKIVQRANEVTGGRVEVRNFDFRMSNLTANVYGLIVHGSESDPNRPLFAVDHIYIDLKLISLVHRKVDLNEIIVEHPVVRLSSDKNGTSNLPHPNTPKDPDSKPINVFDLGIRHVLLKNGEVYYNQEKSPLSAELHDLETEVNYELLGLRYVGRISYRGGRLQLVDSPPLPHDINLSFSATPSELSVNSAVFRVASSRVQLEAKVSDFGNPKVDGKYEALIHTQDFRSLVSGPSFAAGDVLLSGWLSYHNVPGQPLLRNAAIHGKLESRELQLVTPQAHLPVRAIHSDYRLANGNVEATGFAADLWGGHLTAEFNMLHLDETPSAKFHADIRGISLETIRNSATSAQLKTVPLRGAIDASAVGGWRGAIKNLRARSDISLRGAVAHDGATQSVPLIGALHLNYDGPRNLLALEDTYFRSAHTTVSAGGSLGDDSELQLQARAGDLREFSALVAALRPPNKGTAQHLNLSGSGIVTAVVRGSIKRPQIAAQIGVQNLQVENGRWRTLRLGLEANPSGIRVHDGSLVGAAQGEASFSINVALKDWSYGESNPIAARLAVRQMSVGQLLQLAGQDYPIDGNLAADISLEGSQLNPSGNGSVEITQANVYKQPIQTISLNFKAAGDSVVSRLQVQMPGGPTTADITLHPKSRGYEFRVDTRSLNLAQLQAVKDKNLPLSGTLTASGNGRGTFDNPQLSATVQIPTLQVRQATINQVKAEITVSDHRAELSLASEVANSSVQAHGTVNLTGEYDTTASVETKGVSLASLIALYKPVPDQFQGQLELHASAKGPLKNQAAIEAHAEVSTLTASYGQLQIGNAGPIKVDYANALLKIAPSELRGTETALRFEGEVPVRGSAPPRLSVQGSVNLQLLKMVSPDVESSGQLALDLRATRNRAGGFGAQGQARLENAALNTVTSPLGLQNLNGIFDIQDNDVRITQFNGKLGGGDMKAGGTITYKPQLRFNMAVNASGVRLRYPEGVRTVLNSDLTLVGTGDESSLNGRVLLDNVSFTQDFDLGDFIGQFTGSASAPSSGEGFTQRMKLNVAVQTTSRLNLVSSTVSLNGQVNLRVVGTLAEPVITGRADLNSGELFFMHRRYQVVRGVINFANPNRTEPVVNMLITTTVNQYNLNMTFIGPVERLRTTYTSEPPLSPVDIINLLARGQTTEEAAPANLNANSILAQGLASQVGGQIQKLAGFSSLQIDPTIGGNGTNPTARVAMQQRVTKNFIFTFSTDVTDPESQVVQGEYQINNRWSVTALRTQTGGYAFNAKYHRNF